MLTWADVWLYIRTLLRWWPILVVATALASGTAWFLARSQPDFYQARASVMVGNNFEVTTPNPLAVDLSNGLAKFYEVLLRREVILSPVAEQLQLPFPWQLINEMLYTEVNPRANLLEISITDSSPERAAALANALADQLIIYSPNAPDKVATQQAEVDRQIAETQATLADLDRKILELEERQKGLNAAVDLRENQQQLDELGKSRDRYQESYNQLFSLRNSSSVNTLQFFERAEVPQYALPQKTLLIVGAAGMGGLLLAIIAVLLIDRLDPRWRNGRDLQERSGIVHLGAVAFRQPFTVSVSGPSSQQRAVRETHTRIALEASDRLPRLLLVSSPEPSEPRSAYVIELANIYAQAGHRVLLVDAELSRPHVSRLLTESSVAQADRIAPNAIERWSGGPFRSHKLPAELQLHLRPTPMANVALLPSSGRDSDGFSMLVPSLHWPDLVESLRDAADIVIFDGPSALTGADAALLAPLVDGVVLTLNPKQDSLAAVHASKERLLRNGGARLLGAVTLSDERGSPAAQQPRSSRSYNGNPKLSDQPVKRFALSVGADGITITLPARKALADRQSEASPIKQLDAAEYSQGLSARAVGEPIAAEFVERPRSAAQPAPTIITPPPSMAIVTPPPAEFIAQEHEAGGALAPQQSSPRRRARVAGQARRASRTRPAQHNEE
jgi:polysaccharide biosynthesis transport protein